MADNSQTEKAPPGSVQPAGSVREIAIMLGTLLAKHGVVDSPAIYDPEGYDNYETIGRVRAVAEDLYRWHRTR